MPLFYSQSIELLTSRARVRRSFRVVSEASGDSARESRLMVPYFPHLRQIKMSLINFQFFLNRLSRGHYASKPVESFFHCFYIIPFTGKNNVSNGKSSSKIY